MFWARESGRVEVGVPPHSCAMGWRPPPLEAPARDPPSGRPGPVCTELLLNVLLPKAEVFWRQAVRPRFK